MATGDKIAGVDVLVKVNTGTVQAPIMTVIGGQSGASLSRSRGMIEVTNKQSSGWAEKLPGIAEWSVDCDAFFVVGDAGYKALSDAFKNKTILPIEIAVSTGTGSTKFTGNAYLSDLPLEFGQDDAVTFSLTLEGTGALTETIA